MRVIFEIDCSTDLARRFACRLGEVWGVTGALENGVGAWPMRDPSGQQIGVLRVEP